MVNGGAGFRVESSGRTGVEHGCLGGPLSCIRADRACSQAASSSASVLARSACNASLEVVSERL